MVIKEIREIDGIQYVYHYSDKGFFIECDGIKYSSAIDTFDSKREYTETTELIEDDFDTRLIKIEETNKSQDELINTTMLATDEMFMMLEPLLPEVAQTINLERSVSKMVDLYVAMVQRGLKTIDEVPTRYREQVKEILAKLEK